MPVVGPNCQRHLPGEEVAPRPGRGTPGGSRRIGRKAANVIQAECPLLGPPGPPPSRGLSAAIGFRVPQPARARAPRLLRGFAASRDKSLLCLCVGWHPGSHNAQASGSGLHNIRDGQGTHRRKCKAPRPGDPTGVRYFRDVRRARPYSAAASAISPRRKRTNWATVTSPPNLAAFCLMYSSTLMSGFLANGCSRRQDSA